MLSIKSVLSVAALALAFSAQAADRLTVIVAGSKTGTLTLASNMLANDSKNNLLNGRTVELIEPGNACRGFAEAVERQEKDTFLVPIENLYAQDAQLKNDPLCPVPDVARATPVFTETQSLFLIVRQGTAFDQLKTQTLTVGHSSVGQLAKDWHQAMNQKFNQPHRYVGYQGSGNLIKGMLSKEVDAVWTTWSGYNRLVKTEPDSFVIVAASAPQSGKDFPLITDLLNDASLSRGFVITWWLFNDQNNQAKELSKTLKQLNDTAAGEWGRWAVENKKEFLFDQSEQRKVISSQSWIK